MRLPLKPCNQPGFLKTRQPPTQRPLTLSDDFERQQIAQLIETDDRVFRYACQDGAQVERGIGAVQLGGAD
jgi:hypothetical protein